MDTNSLIHEILKLSQLSPSIHNTQIWQIKSANNKFTIYLNEKYLVPIADPEYRDTWVSLGVLIDIIENIFNEYSTTADTVILQSQLKINPAKPVVEINYEDTPLKSPVKSNYISLLQKRRSFRGNFTKSSALPTLTTKNTHIISNSAKLKSLCKTYHDCAAMQSLNKGYMDELRYWVRLDKNEPGFGQDGLDFQSLNLNSLETLLAKAFLNDKWVQRFKKIGLHGLLTDESKNFKNISGVVIKTMDNTNITPELLISEGRSYISIWLQLVEQGFEACPISTLIDLPKGHDFLKKNLSLPDDTLFSVALRFGIGDQSPVRRVRRPTDSLLMK